MSLYYAETIYIQFCLDLLDFSEDIQTQTFTKSEGQQYGEGPEALEG